MKMKKSSIPVLLTVLSVAAYAAPQIPAPAVVVEEATTAPDIYKRRYVGNIVPINNVYSTAKVSGDLISQGFKDGQYVKAGQLLFEIDPTRYAAAVKSTEAKLAQIKAKLAYAENNLLRKKELLDKFLIALPEPERRMYRGQLWLLGPTKLSDVEESRKRIVRLAMDLAVQGKVKLPSRFYSDPLKIRA